ncbi:MAG: hypothetical protein J0M18_08475 [Ignavibacteria bacterium]|nr:hypothetical protein [Ignavibacteria bacterium]
MAFSKTLVSDSVVQRLIEQQNIYNSCNRGFDALVRPGATSVDIPDLAIPKVKKTGTTSTHADRKNAKGDTALVNVALGPYAVPLANEITAQWESNGILIKEYLDSAALVLGEQFDSEVITEAQTGTKTAFAGSSMAWGDLTALKKRMDKNKIPQTGRVLVVSADLVDEFFAIDTVKNATSYNRDYLESGKVPSLLGFQIFISGLVPTVTVSAAQKVNMTAFYGPGLAFIMGRQAELKEVYDEENLKDIKDLVCQAGLKLLNTKFAEVIYKP